MSVSLTDKLQIGRMRAHRDYHVTILRIMAACCCTRVTVRGNIVHGGEGSVIKIAFNRASVPLVFTRLGVLVRQTGISFLKASRWFYIAIVEHLTIHFYRFCDIYIHMHAYVCVYVCKDKDLDKLLEKWSLWTRIIVTFTIW